MSLTEFAMVEELAFLIKDNLPCKHLIISMEETLVNFLLDDTSSDGILELEPTNPYNRLLLHRLADIFVFSHQSVGEGEARHLVLERFSDTSMYDELTRKFFKDGRSFDMEGLKSCMRRGYSYLEGVEGLLNSLKKNGYEIHAFTNYPIWYQMIEDELKFSNYISWTFFSCIFGKWKPGPDFYSEVVKHLDVKASNCIFVDDRMKNVEAATELGLKGLQFKNADMLRNDLSLLGVDISTNESQDLIECSS